MGDKDPSYYSSFEPPSVVITLKGKKRALVDRISASNSTADLPKKRSRGGAPPSPKSTRAKKRPFLAAPPPRVEDIATSEHSLSLFDLFSASKQRPCSLSQSPPPSSSLSSSPSTSSTPNHSPSSRFSLLAALPPAPTSQTTSYLDLIQTPPQQLPQQKKRQQLTPAPLIGSTRSHKAHPFQFGGAPRKRGVNLKDRFADEADSCVPEPEWSPLICLDWSLKTKLTILSSKSFGFHSSTTGLKSSEESSGTSAFARCIDIDPSLKDSSSSSGDSPLVASQLDTSLGAQFHQCCLYWQHPNLPGVDLFPRDQGSSASGGSSFSFISSSSTGGAGTPVSSSAPLGGIRMEQKVFDTMFTEWTDSFRSAFQLLRTRQCPYFYVCTNQFTCLFSAAGTQGLEYLQAYISPCSKGLRDAFSHEGIEFTTPCSAPSEGSPEANNNKAVKVVRAADKKVKEVDESDEEPDKWLDEMGISQDVSISLNTKTSPTTSFEEKNKSSLVVIVGTNTLALFNLLTNSKNLLVSSTGAFAGLPPTILCPVAFHGATLKKLKMKLSTSAKGKASPPGNISHSIEMTGPILPHVIHMLGPVLKKTVENFRIRLTPHSSTVNLNLNSRYTTQQVQTNAFELQNLSDCGLTKRVLEAFCRSDNVDTISSMLECKDGLFRWS